MRAGWWRRDRAARPGPAGAPWRRWARATGGAGLAMALLTGGAAPHGILP